MEPRSPKLCRTFPPSCSFFFRWLWKKLPKSHKRSHSINSVDQNGIRFAHFSLHLCCTFELPCLCGISPPPPRFSAFMIHCLQKPILRLLFISTGSVFFFLELVFSFLSILVIRCFSFHLLPFSHFFHPRCVLSFFCCPPILTYTHCASQAPERSNICVLLCSAVW